MKYPVIFIPLLLLTASCATTKNSQSPNENGSRKVASSESPVEMKFVHIPAGTFMMGSPAGEPGRDPRMECQVKVKISKDFEMQTTSVTQFQFYQLMKRVPGVSSKNYEDCPQSYTDLSGDLKPKSIGLCPNFPVRLIDVRDAQEFIDKLNNLDRDYDYWLPTEGEWEYAARAGTTTAYSFGDDPSQLRNYAWYADNCETDNEELSPGRSYQKCEPHNVGTKNPNPWGLYDMYGGMAQFTWASFPLYWEGKNCPDKNKLHVDPKGALPGVVRGGRFTGKADELRSASRYGGDNLGAGFRLARRLKVAQ